MRLLIATLISTIALLPQTVSATHFDAKAQAHIDKLARNVVQRVSLAVAKRHPADLLHRVEDARGRLAVDRRDAGDGRVSGQGPVERGRVGPGVLRAAQDGVGDAVDLAELPAPMLHDGDGGRFLGTWDIVVSQDPRSGETNWGVYRFMVHDSRTLTGGPAPSSGLGKPDQPQSDRWRRTTRLRPT